MDATRMKRTAVGFIGGMAMLLGVLGGATGAAAAGAVTLSAPEPYEGGGSGGVAIGSRFAKGVLLIEQEGTGRARSQVGPTAEVG